MMMQMNNSSSNSGINLNFKLNEIVEAIWIDQSKNNGAFLIDIPSNTMIRQHLSRWENLKLIWVSKKKNILKILLLKYMKRFKKESGEAW